MLDAIGMLFIYGYLGMICVVVIASAFKGVELMALDCAAAAKHIDKKLQKRFEEAKREEAEKNV